MNSWLKWQIIKQIASYVTRPKKDEHEEMIEPLDLSVNQLEDQLILDEGLRLKPYKDSVGKLTVGVGHNLTNGLSHAAVMYIFKEDLNSAINDAKTLPYYNNLNSVRKAVIINMIFNMGLSTFKRFKLMGAALEAGDYKEASKQMLNSKWAKQVGQRAIRLSKQMLKGE